MAATTFRDEQQLRNPGLLALLLLFSLLMLYRLAVSLQQPAVAGRDMLALAAIASLLAVGWYLVYRSRLRIKVSPRCVKVKFRGMLGRKLKLPVRDMVACHYVDIPPAARWSGDLAYPVADLTCIDFGGRRGLCVSMRDGQSYFIGSDALYNMRHELPLPVAV